MNWSRPLLSLPWNKKDHLAPGVHKPPRTAHQKDYPRSTNQCQHALHAIDRLHIKGQPYRRTQIGGRDPRQVENWRRIHTTWRKQPTTQIQGTLVGDFTGVFTPPPMSGAEGSQLTFERSPPQTRRMWPRGQGGESIPITQLPLRVVDGRGLLYVPQRDIEAYLPNFPQWEEEPQTTLEGETMGDTYGGGDLRALLSKLEGRDTTR